MGCDRLINKKAMNTRTLLLQTWQRAAGEMATGIYNKELATTQRYDE